MLIFDDYACTIAYGLDSHKRHQQSTVFYFRKNLRHFELSTQSFFNEKHKKYLKSRSGVLSDMGRQCDPNF